MPKPSMKGALGASLQAETSAFQARLAKADALAERLELQQGERGEESVRPQFNADSGAASANTTSEVVGPANPEIPAIPKVIREAFTIPETEHGQIELVRSAMLSRAIAVSKSEVLRAGLLMLSEADEETRLAIFERLERVKTGRPKTV